MANETGQPFVGHDLPDAVMDLGARGPSGRTTGVGSPAPESNTQAPIMPPEMITPLQSAAVTLGHPAPDMSTPGQAPAVTALLPPGLFCGPNVCFDWNFTEPLGIGNTFFWRMRFAFYSNMTCRVVFFRQHEYAPNPCYLRNSYIYSGTFVVHGQQMVFTLRGQQEQTDTCNPSNNFQGPISGSMTCGWSFDSATNILTLTLPFVFGEDNWRIFKLRKIIF